MTNLYKDVGCSQECHLPNCGHFGYVGTYLSEHADWCDWEKYRDRPCTCNPEARKKAKI